MKNIKLKNWKLNIDEISNGVYKVFITHKLGYSIGKIGSDLESLKNDVELSALEIENSLN